jgi:hypothetical protein
MRKILSTGLFLIAAAAIAAQPQAASSLVVQVLGELAVRAPSQLMRDYGVMLLVLAMPTAVLAWGVWHEARVRARTEV